MSYGPMRGKIGKFNASDKNAINKQVQAEISLRKNPEIAKRTVNTFRSTKRAGFTDKNSEIKRRQQQTANTNEWMNNVTSMFGADARVEKGAGGAINVFSGFQKMEYKNDPWGYGNVELQDIDAYVPEGFTKIMNEDGTARIVGNKIKYRSYYKNPSEGKTKKKYAEYFDTEAFLDVEGNLTKSVKRKDYYTEKKSTDKYSRKKKGVMTTEEILYGADNKKVQQQNWGSYKADEYDKYEINAETGRKKKTRSEDEYSTYLTKKIDFNQGIQQTYSRPGTKEKTKYAYASSVSQQPQNNIIPITNAEMKEAGLAASDGYFNYEGGGILNANTGQSMTIEAAQAEKTARETAKANAEQQKAFTDMAEKVAEERRAKERAAAAAEAERKQQAIYDSIPKPDNKGQDTYVPSYARNTWDYS